MSSSLDDATDLLLNGEKQATKPAEGTTSAVATFFIFLKSYLGSGIMVGYEKCQEGALIRTKTTCDSLFLDFKSFVKSQTS